MVRVRGL